MIPKHQSKIEEMIVAAAEAMQNVENTTHAELLGAVFSLTMRTIAAVLEFRPDLRDDARKAAEVLLLNCADPNNPV